MFLFSRYLMCSFVSPSQLLSPSCVLFHFICGILWASLVAQLVKNPSVMWETWVRSLGWEVPLEKGKTTHSSILA